MTNVHILGNYGKIFKQDEHLLYKDRDGNIVRILPSHTGMIALYGNISLTGEAISMLSKNHIPLLMKTGHGKSNVSLNYGDGKNVFLRLAQYRLYENEEKSALIARSIVVGKIRNQLAFMQRIKRSRQAAWTEEITKDFELAAQRMKALMADARKLADVKSLRGVEGFCSRLYFSALKNNIIPSWAKFESRSRQPPLSNVNAVLSFLYALLSDEVTFIIESRGLDSMIGSLHELSYSRNSLTYDLMEEFRTPVADTLCCRLFNNKILCEADFEPRDGGVFLTKEGRKKVVKGFEEKMQEDYREILFSQSELYKDVVMGRAVAYEPFVFK